MHNLQIHEQGSKIQERPSSIGVLQPTSIQVRVLFVQAFVAAYLQDLPLRFFSYKLLNSLSAMDGRDRPPFN